jgi:hypothetical protein
MAKRKAKTRTRTARRKAPKKAARKASRPARKAASKKAARPKARAARKAPRRRRAASAKTGGRKAAAKPRTPARTPPARPKPAALSRERRQLREEDTIPGAPSTLNFATRASAAESGHQMYHQRAKDHTEDGDILTGGDVDSDWNDAYSSGEETPGGDMSTPDQDVVEEIGRALGVEYEDSEELKGADKIENRDRNRWEYDPASAEDYKDRNRRDS